jgi:anthranilate synthase component 1
MRYAEPKLRLSGGEDNEKFKDVDLMLFDKVIAFDRLENTIALIVNVKTDALEENFSRGQLALEELKRIVFGGTELDIPPLTLKSEFKPMFSREQFCEMVNKAKHYIREGDIFQVVLSNRYEAEAEGSLFETYEILRESNPSPYMFYFSSDDVEIAGSAPETLVKLREETVFTFPLAGTRPRGETPEEDGALERELLSDQKELAEHNMLVDLGRNDIGKIAQFGSVKVGEYLSVERFSHVMHIGSTVTGRIRSELGGVDAINALLPAGTLSGAPKFRACEIINELEGGKRGIYGGAIGYMALNGDMDTCIAIRIAFKKNGRVFIRSGAGIVADSVPETEFEECAGKLRAVKLALEKASGGVQ